ncbi:transposable element Tc1 transposase [Trichonephila clavipes]|nr:transposable element Tc1 transposase [Trichonephila clavipes]
MSALYDYARTDHYATCRSLPHTVEPDYSGAWLDQYPSLIFQQDKAGPHTERVTMNDLTAFQTLPWSTKSLDLSPIGHFWDMMDRQLHLPGNVDDLTRQLEQIWQGIPQETIRVLYHSMPRRVAACI